MKVIYAGSFNLFHAGHYYVYDQACKMFGKDNVWLCVAINPNKEIDPEFIKWTLNPITPNVIIASGLVTKEEPDVLVRGLRDSMDLSTELTMSDWNRELGCKTIFIPCSGSLRHISSSALRELIWHGIKIDGDDNIPPQIRLTYERWLEGEMPERKLFCGKIAIGKSTYLKSITDQMETWNHIGDCDELIWQFFDEEEKKFIKTQLTTIINTGGDQLGYQAILKEMTKKINWDALFNGYYHYEVSALGQWMHLIPNYILCQFQIVELEIDRHKRVKRFESRGLTMDQIRDFDEFYKSPYFVDERIDIGEWQ